MSKANPYDKSKDPLKRSHNWVDYERGTIKARAGWKLPVGASAAMRLGYDDHKAAA